MKALLIVFLLYAQTAFCQIKVRPVVEAGYGKNLMENFYSTNVLSAGTGIKLNERFYFQINFIQSKETQKQTPDESDKKVIPSDTEKQETPEPVN